MTPKQIMDHGLNEGEDWLNRVLAYIGESQEYVANYFRDNIPLIGQTKPEGTYLNWLDVSRIIDIVGAKETAAERERTSVDPVTPEMVMQEWFGQHARVDLNPGSSYGTGGAGHMRMNIAVSRKLLKLALDNIAEAVDRLPEGARNVFILHAVYGYTHDETGEMLGIATGTSKAQLHRAKRLLAQQLKQQGFEA